MKIFKKLIFIKTGRRNIDLYNRSLPKIRGVKLQYVLIKDIVGVTALNCVVAF